MKELIISIYLLGFKILFTLFKIFPLKNKVTFLISFPDNSMYVYEELKRQNICIQTVFLCNYRCFEAFKKTCEFTYLIESKNLFHTLVGIYHLATSKQVIVDNYYGFLAVSKFKKGVKCTQIWHSVGAIKQFGAKDPSNVNRRCVAIKRFKAVYGRFNHIVVGSDFMSEIFKEAFLASNEVFLKIGIPRTDFFFEFDKQAVIKSHFYNSNPILKEKQVILYAPTFRKGEGGLVTDIALDISMLYVALKDEYVLIIKFHPAVKLKLDFIDKYSDFVFDYSEYSNVNELLVITDVLITDYSSIPMEFAFFRRKMMFFAYDLEDYKKNNGFWEDFESSIPGPIVYHTNEMIDVILNQEIDTKRIEAYVKKWAEYCEGNSSEKLVNILF